MTLDVQALGRTVKRLQNRNHRQLDASLVTIGTTLAQWDALRTINDHPGASAHVLAEQSFQTDQSFGALATRLIEKGLVDRRQGKGRSLVHSLTDEGRLMFERGTAIAVQVIEASFAALSELERRQLLDLLKKVLSANPGAQEPGQFGHLRATDIQPQRRPRG
jgi:DNA-binding MarR family transcriptional regulator